MQIAHIWYRASETELFQKIIKEQKPNWKFVSIPENALWDLSEIVKLLRKKHDAILVHLSMRYCLALKMAELVHRNDNPTRIILSSRTHVDHSTLLKLFDGIIRPDKDIDNFVEKIEQIVSSKRIPLKIESEIEAVILSIFNASKTLQSYYRASLDIRHKEKLDFNDYCEAVNLSATREKNDSNSPFQFDLFISHSAQDALIAQEIALLCADNNIRYFMAERDIQGGDNWTDKIRDCLIGSEELLVIITPNSVRSSWVMIESGAAWILKKTITPCTLFVKSNELPTPISQHQVKSIETYSQKKDLLKEIKERLLSRKS